LEVSVKMFGNAGVFAISQFGSEVNISNALTLAQVGGAKML